MMTVAKPLPKTAFLIVFGISQAFSHSFLISYSCILK